MRVKPTGKYLILITKPAALTAEQRTPQEATLSEDGTTFNLIRKRKGAIAVGTRSAKIIACGITIKKQKDEKH